MFILVRDEDPATVAAAIGAFADEEGLEPIDLEEQAQNPLNVLAVLGGPRAIVSESGGQVFVAGLESLDIAEPEEWAAELSASCESEVLALEVTELGLRVHVFDGGERDETVDVPLDPSGKTRAPALVDLTDSEEGQRELESGVAANGIEELVPAILRCLGVVPADAEGAIMLAFHDPLADDDGLDDPALVAEALTGARLDGAVNRPVDSPHGNVFGVVVVGIESVEGLRLELSGDALALVRIDRVEAWLRVRGAHELEQRVLALPRAEEDRVDTLMTIDLADAYLEHVSTAPPALDMSDLFSSMQRLMSASDAQHLNTLTLHVSGVGLRAGEGELALRVSALAGALAPGEASLPVRVEE